MATTQTLLDKARAIPARKVRGIREDDEFTALCVAWLAEEVATVQVAGALGLDTSDTKTKGYTAGLLYRIARQLQVAYRQGLIAKAEGK